MGNGALSGATMGRGHGRPSAAIVRLRDVARLELGAQNYNQACSFDGKPSVGLGLYQLPGTNALDVADAVRKKMEELKTRFPDGVDYAIGYDTTPYIRESIQDVLHDAARGRRAGRHRGAVFPARLAGHDPADDRRARLADRHLRRHGPLRLQPQQHLAVRSGAGHRHRGGRRHRGAGEHRADDRQRPAIRAPPPSRPWTR